MKRFFSLLALFAALTWTLPVAGAMGSQLLASPSPTLEVQPAASPDPAAQATPAPSAQPEASPIPVEGDLVPILNTDTGQVEQVPLEEFDFPDDGICVLGGEEDGVSPDVLALCSSRVSIEQFGAKGSINVSVAAGILLHAWAMHSSKS